jgi:hypothetical protein
LCCCLSNICPTRCHTAANLLQNRTIPHQHRLELVLLLLLLLLLRLWMPGDEAAGWVCCQGPGSVDACVGVAG